MRGQYRSAGLTVALGAPSVAYTEGCGAGGGSEVNSGLYHRPPAPLLEDWRTRWHVEDLDERRLDPLSAEIERELSVAPWPLAALPAPSSVLQRGAERLGWHGFDVPRWARYTVADDHVQVERQTMTRTYLRSALDAGAELWTATRAVALEHDGGRVSAVRLERGGRVQRVVAAQFFVCCGAVQTPALLQRSGLRRNIGHNLSVHPTVKAVAEFDAVVNDPADLATYQVKEFGSWLSFGGSASRQSLVALALSENWDAFGGAVERWRHQVVYYAATRSQGRGTVRAVPGRRDPLVTYRITGDDMTWLRTAMARLAAPAAGGRRPHRLPLLPGRPGRHRPGRRRRGGGGHDPVPGEPDDRAPVRHRPHGGGPPAQRRRLPRTGVGAGEPPGQRRLAAAGRSRGEPAGHRHGDRAAQRRPLPPTREPGVPPIVPPAPPARWKGPTMTGVLLEDPPLTILTGAGGWFGRAYLDAVARGRTDGVGPVARAGRVRVLVARASEVPEVLEVHPDAEVHVGDVTDERTLGALFRGAGGASLVHAAGVIHPRRAADFDRVNHLGTQRVVDGAARAGVRRMVHVSSNSPFGTNPHGRTTRSDEDEPYHPYLGYGRVEDARPSWPCATPSSGAARRDDRAAAVVLRAVPARAADARSSAWCAGAASR